MTTNLSWGIDMNSNQDYAATILRVTLGVIYLAHSAYLKLMVFSLPGTAQFFESIGLPGVFAYLVFTVEVVGGIALIIGYQVRIAAAGLAVVALGATWVHFGNGWLFSNAGGGWEYPAFLAVATVVQALLGAGAFALKPGDRRVDTAAANA